MGILDKLKIKLQTKEGKIIALFVLVEFCLWIPILVLTTGDFFKPYLTVTCSLKLAAIVLLPIVAFLLKKNEIFIGALLATVGADVFLSYVSKLTEKPFSETGEIIGMSFFFAVQVILAIYFFVLSKNKKQQLYIIIARAISMVLFGCLAMLMPRQEPQVYIMAVYLPNIILNAICAGLQKDKPIMIALIIYIVSDVFVGVGNIGVSLPFTFSWLLYLPANVMLVIYEKTGSYFFPVAKNENKEYSN